MKNLVAVLVISAIVASGSGWLIWELATGVTSFHSAETPNPRREPLPKRCNKYYNDGTSRWQTCMGVGRR